MKFNLHVINDEKRPQSGLCVEVSLPESFPLSPGAGQMTEYTDENGHATFETTDDRCGEVTVIVNGENKGRFDLEDGAEITVVL